MASNGVKLHWMPFYLSDWETDETVRRLGPAGRYFYIALLLHQWREGSIPADPEILLRLLANGPPDYYKQEVVDAVRAYGRRSLHILDMASILSEILPFFDSSPEPGRLCNSKLASIRNYYIRGPRGSRPKRESRRLAANEWMEVRTVVFRRDNYTCVYCSARGIRLECDHDIPVALGGTNELSNLVTACFDCNRSKRCLTGAEFRDSLLHTRNTLFSPVCILLSQSGFSLGEKCSKGKSWR